MAISFGDLYNVDPAAFEATGALDPVLGVDTRLFIDPSLLTHFKTPELAESASRVSQYFTNVLTIISNIRHEDDAFWRRANRLLTFPEVQGLCIGYSSSGTAGKGAGRVKRKRLLETMRQLVEAGCENPRIFDLVGAFEEGVGPDLISDMTAKIIMPDLISFTQRVCSDLGIPMESVSYAGSLPEDDLPINPHTNIPIILIPKEILRDLPVAEDFADIFWISSHNDALRDELNKVVANSFRDLTSAEKKAKVKAAFIDYPEVLVEVLKTYTSSPASFYDFADDPSGEVIWYRESKSAVLASDLRLFLPTRPTANHVFDVVKLICQQFKTLLEDNQLCRLLYDRNHKPKHESAAQLLFFGIASAYCRANDLDLSPESDGGRGPVDFKVSAGLEAKVLVEIKLSRNAQLIHGFERQLPIYQQAEGAALGIYLVIGNGGLSKARREAFNLAITNAGDQAPRVVWVDGTRRDSASKAEI